MRDAFVSALSSLAEVEPRIMLITADLGFGVLTNFAERFPRQFLNVGVAEQNMIGVAAGLAMEGRKVFTYSIGNFPVMRCLEQIRNDVCYHDVDVTVVAVGGGFSYGSLGFSHHATEDIAVMRALPGMTVTAPGDDLEAAELTRAIAVTPGPSYLRLDKSSVCTPSVEPQTIHLGRARLVRDGRDITLVTTGGILSEALMAADDLAAESIACRVLSMHTLKPIDANAIMSACRETGGIVTIEEHTVDGGLGSAVAEACVDSGVFPARFRRIGLRCGMSSVVGSQNYLRQRHSIDRRAIVSEVRSLFHEEPGRRPTSLEE